jgi:hypothetical protein
MDNAITTTTNAEPVPSTGLLHFTIYIHLIGISLALLSDSHSVV